jgi:hypothetical protein
MAFHPFRINEKVRKARKALERDASIRRNRGRRRKRRRTRRSNSFLR